MHEEFVYVDSRASAVFHLAYRKSMTGVWRADLMGPWWICFVMMAAVL